MPVSIWSKRRSSSLLKLSSSSLASARSSSDRRPPMLYSSGLAQSLRKPMSADRSNFTESSQNWSPPFLDWSLVRAM